jgi:hypothetical protein
MNEVFNNIYLSQKWDYSNNETLSGSGSTRAVNKYRICFLADFVNENNLLEIYDICGDCNWQSDFIKLIKNKKVIYHGFDISEHSLSLARKKNSSNNQMVFPSRTINLCEESIKCANGKKSLIIIKEVIQHLPLVEAKKMLTNIKRSGFNYIAITNHDARLHDVKKNNDTIVGGFSPYNVFLPPFNFKNPLKDVNDLIDNDDEKRGLGNLIIFDIQEQDSL